MVEADDLGGPAGMETAGASLWVPSTDEPLAGVALSPIGAEDFNFSGMPSKSPVAFEALPFLLPLRFARLGPPTVDLLGNEDSGPATAHTDAMLPSSVAMTVSKCDCEMKVNAD